MNRIPISKGHASQKQCLAAVHTHGSYKIKVELQGRPKRTETWVILLIRLPFTLQSLKGDVGLEVAAEEDSRSPLAASPAEFRVLALLGALRKMPCPGQALAAHLGAVLAVLRTQVFHLLRDLRTGPFSHMPSEGAPSGCPPELSPAFPLLFCVVAEDFLVPAPMLLWFACPAAQKPLLVWKGMYLWMTVWSLQTDYCSRSTLTHSNHQAGVNFVSPSTT